MNGILKFKRDHKLPCVIQLVTELESELDQITYSKERAHVLIVSACSSLRPLCFIVKSNKWRDR